MNDDVLMTATATGHQIRLRYGRNQRGRFTIATLDEPRAQRRANRLRDLAALLATQNKPAIAKDILTQCAAAKNDAEFQELCRHIEDFAGVKTAKPTGATTFKDLATDWTSGELHRKYPDYVKLKRSVDNDKGRLERLYESIGTVPIERFTLADAKRAMAKIPEGRSSATRRHYAQLISKVLKIAVYPCELLDRSPLPVGFLPSVTNNKAKSFLYPSEDAKLLACPEVLPSLDANGQQRTDASGQPLTRPGVPLAFRVLYGFLAREGLRLGEALSLRWADLDLALGVIRLDANKTDEPRAWKLSPGVPEALGNFRPKGTKDSDLVFAGFDEDRVAETFRTHLKRAEVKRAELFEGTDNRRKIRAHDLRATFITLALANDWTETWVQDRTGHKSSVMVNRYRRQARQANELKLGTLAPLNEAIPELAGPKSGPPSVPPTPIEGQVQAVPKSQIEDDLRCSPSRTRTGIPVRVVILNPLRLPFRQGAEFLSLLEVYCHKLGPIMTADSVSAITANHVGSSISNCGIGLGRRSRHPG